jgi:hypothetical protein
MEATPMKLITVVSTAALAVLLGISAPLYAQQDEHPQEEKRAQPEDKAERGQEKQEDKQVDKDKEKDQDKQVEKNKADKQVEEKQTDKEKVNKSAEQEEKSAHPAEARGEGKPGGRIPDDRFRANFGREHTFHVGRPVVVEGVPRFQYAGYWFVMVQPWPVGWAYTDVVYVDYIGGGYYLLSPVHPGVQISINVIL